MRRAPLLLVLLALALSAIGCNSAPDVTANGVADKEKEIAASRAKAGIDEQSHDQQ